MHKGTRMYGMKSNMEFSEGFEIINLIETSLPNSQPMQMKPHQNISPPTSD
jgi:hypothetical protein